MDTNISVYLAWIPGHASVGDNEKVDKLAKMMSQDIYRVEFQHRHLFQ